MMILLQ